VTRIIGGSAGGRRLRTPHGSTTRPTADRVREALFSSLESELGTVAGIRFLDLFAGSGAVGLEARSRGASYVVLVEADRQTAALIRGNVRDLGFDDVEVHAMRAERFVESLAHPGDDNAQDQPFDVVYVDPPYAMGTPELGEVLDNLVRSARVSDETVVVVERSRRGSGWNWPDAMRGVRERRYGETMLYYGRPAGATVVEPGSDPVP
jgi:16S rRNA (guanine966-N2)-methyltransferase